VVFGKLGVELKELQAEKSELEDSWMELYDATQG